LSEASGKRFEVDLVRSRRRIWRRSAANNCCSPVKSPYFKDLIKNAVPAHHEYASVADERGGAGL